MNAAKPNSARNTGYWPSLNKPIFCYVQNLFQQYNNLQLYHHMDSFTVNMFMQNLLKAIL